MRGFENVPVDWSPASVWSDDDGVRHQTVEFIVPGRPVPKGNVIKGRYGGYHDATKGLPEWSAVVSAQAAAAMKGAYRDRLQRVGTWADVITIFDSAVMVDVTFVMPRPKSTPKRKTPPAVKKPDVDKAVRSILDSMTGVIYHDDSQVIEIHARKRLADIDETPGAIILVTSNVRVQ